jgi:hypothetical protein
VRLTIDAGSSRRHHVPVVRTPLVVALIVALAGALAYYVVRDLGDLVVDAGGAGAASPRFVRLPDREDRPRRFHRAAEVAGTRVARRSDMLRLISLVLLVTSCATTAPPRTAAEHEEQARHYEATANSIEDECWKDLRHQMTIDAHKTLCWRAEDIRFLEANRNAAVRERAKAAALRDVSASR